MVRLATSSAESTGRAEEIVHNAEGVRNQKVVFEGLGYLYSATGACPSLSYANSSHRKAEAKVHPKSRI